MNEVDSYLHMRELHRVDPSALQQEDGGMSVNFAGDEPMEPWTFAQLLLGGFAVLVLLASLAWAVFINRQVIAYAIGQVFV